MKDLVFKDFEYVQDALYYSKEKILIISDLHIGLGLNYNRMQYNISIEESKRLISKIQKIKKDIDRIVILGDIKHSFSYREDEDFELRKFFSNLKKIINEIVIVVGNHDKITNYFDVEIVDKYEIIDSKKKYLLFHGDKVISNKDEYDLIIFGHEHTKINLMDKNSMRVESYKCFLRGANFIILPNFNDFSGGNNVLDLNFLNRNFSKSEMIESEVIISENNILNLGKLKSIREILD